MNNTDSNRNGPKVHSFNVDDAIKYGTDKAAILYNIKFWLEHNRANNTNFHDGHWWTYNSADAFEKLFPYMNAKKIARLLRELEKDGEILVGNFNKKGYDRTKWYSTPCYASLSKNEQCIVQKCAMDSPNMSNALSIFAPPIPDSKPNDKPIINTDTQCVASDDVISPSFEDFWNRYDKKIGRKKCADKWAKISNSDKELIMENLPAYLSSIRDKQYQKHPITYLNNESWHDEIITSQPNQLANRGITNATSSHTPHQSPASSNMQQLRAQIAAEQAAKQSNHQHDQEIRTVH